MCQTSTFFLLHHVPPDTLRPCSVQAIHHHASSADCGLSCRHMKREGTIAFNGQPSTKRLKRNIGFVMQVDPT